MSKYNEKMMRPLVEEYIRNKDSRAICERNHIKLATFCWWVKKLGYRPNKRRHFFNEDYFTNVDTEAKAYILGFIMADGSVCKTTKKLKKTNRLVINISRKDKQILEFIKSQLECDYEIIDYIPKHTYAENPMSKLVINSMKLCSDLNKLGIVERKTGHEKIPDNVPDNMVRHFIRGFFDGDGSMHHTSLATQIGTTLSFCSLSTDILHDIEKHFTDIGVASVPKIVAEGTKADGTKKKGFHISYSAKKM